VPAVKLVVEALVIVCKAVQVFAFPKFISQSLIAELPLKEEPLRVEPFVRAFATEPALPVMLAFIEVVEFADHTPAFTAARPFHADEFCPVPPYVFSIAVPFHKPALIVPKALVPEKVLLLARSVEEAAVMV